MTIDTGPTSAELLDAEAERLLVCHGVSQPKVLRYERGREILYLGGPVYNRTPMTAWITVDDNGDEHIATETGWPIERTDRACARPRVLGRDAARADLADQA